MLGDSLDIQSLLFAYLALLITIIGCEMSLSYWVKTYALDCIEENDLVQEGKVTFNPLRYFDVLGTIVFPLLMLVFKAPILFGWSKTLLLNMQKVADRHGLNLAILFASSGVLFHFFIAFLSSLIYSYNSIAQVSTLLEYLILFNVFFALIKLCPILPYDGLKILSYVGLKFGTDLFMHLYYKLLPLGIVILIVVFVTPLNQIILLPAQMILNFLL